ncbi:MAG TPA: hypothetical protein VJ826_00590, partial [Candidatus Polarisedimenticolaceae bacterium]|nr:hypothetical protein [Candidatus Polarisedimenticolaceae bacterium]
NESGKSTMAAALLAALYGFPRQRASRDKPVTTKEHFRPWSGRPFALELDMEARGRQITIRRDFDRDLVTVYDGRTGKEITPEFSVAKDRVDLGESLAGLPLEDFVRCCFVGQREIDGLKDAQSLTHALQRLASSQQGDVAAGEALAALSRAVERDYEGMRLGRGKVDTEVKRLDAEIAEVSAEMDAISARRRASEDRIRRLEEATLLEGRAETGLARVDYLCLLSAREEVGAALRQAVDEQREMETLRADIAQLAPFADFPAERLGEFRELKGKIESLRERRKTVVSKLDEEVTQPLAEAETALSTLSAMKALSEQDLAYFSDRVAVLSELWRTRREKRRALRQEERRLREAGLEPSRVTDLAAQFAPLKDDDRRFLLAYRETSLELKAAMSEAERLRDRLTQAEGGDSPALVSMAVARRVETIALITGIAGLTLTFILWLAIESKIPSIISIGLSLAGFAWWLRLQEKRPVLGAEEFGSDLQRIQTEIWALEKQSAALQDRLLKIAFELGSAPGEQILEEFREMESLRERAAPVAALSASLAETGGNYAAAMEEALVVMQRAGRVPLSRRLTPRGARRFRDDAKRYHEARTRVAELRLERDARAADLRARDEEIRGLLAQCAGSLVPGTTVEELNADLAGALARFEEAAAKRERHDRLTRESLPAAERRSKESPERRVAALTKEMEVLARQVEKVTRQTPELAGLSPVKSSREYLEERRRLQEEVRSTQKERLALSEELGDVLKEYRRDYPGRRALLESLEAARAKAAAFRDAVSIASEALSEIAKEAYAEWAQVLNERTSDILRRIVPHYDDVRFDTDLSFTLRDSRTGQRRDQVVIDTHFSTGARDQVYLAVRMAVSEYLSASGVRLPFILDDPFVTFDDERFERTMEFVVDVLGRRHQIIILSCHAGRHRRWKDAPSGHAAGRVRVLDLTPLET